MLIVHYEVYVQESRGWMLHARFPRQEREEAIREAKELETTLKIRVKVVRETYNTDDNGFDEAEVYISGMIRKEAMPKAGGGGGPARPARPAGGGGGGGGRPAKGNAARSTSESTMRQRAPATGSATGVLWRLLLICLGGLAVALAVVRGTPEVIVFLYDYGFRISPDAYGQLLFAEFVLVFLMVSIPMAFRFLPKNAELNIRKPSFGGSGRSKRPEADVELKRSLNALANKAAAEAPAAPAEEPPPPEELEVLPDIKAHEDEELPEIRPDAEDKPLDPALAAMAATAAADPGSSNVISMRFLGGAIEAVKQVSPSMDKLSTFALNLYMAGAVESLAESRKLDSASERLLLRSALEALGTSSDIAGNFHDRLADYLVEPRNMKIVQAGRNAMDSWMAGMEVGAHAPLATALKEFRRPAANKKQSLMTVMFTDMVGSTDLTQARGDAAAQEVVRRHNAIVRTALAQFMGKEIKHTGDGIMASFNSAANAVEATVVIQRQVAATNAKSPDLGLHLRIGLNAGEPIQEEDDLFGATVQLAARVCAATATDQILCTQVVRDLSLGKTAAFRPAGEHALKGFKEKLPLFEVVWRE